MKKIKLEFGDAGKDISLSLSALVHIGDSIYAAGDEGVDLVRLQANKNGTRFKYEQLIPLNDWFDLPIPPTSNSSNGKKTNVVEIDLEGMDFDRKNRLLWMVGSHSLKRGRALPELQTDQNKERLTGVNSDANRFFLGYVKLKQDKDKKLRFPQKEKNGDKKDTDATRKNILHNSNVQQQAVNCWMKSVAILYFPDFVCGAMVFPGKIMAWISKAWPARRKAVF